MKRVSALLLIIGLMFVWSCTQETIPQSVELFNGENFDGWTLFLPGDSVAVEDVWSIKDGVVHCTGQPNGYMRTNEIFSNYKLTLDWRWVDEPSNSGVLLHCQGENQVWPNCVECQLKAGNAGDFVLIGAGEITVQDTTYVNEERFLVIEKFNESNENEPGEWNTYSIVCDGASIQCTVNGVLQNSGIEASVESGFIALQSEGSPIEFRNIILTPLQ